MSDTARARACRLGEIPLPSFCKTPIELEGLVSDVADVACDTFRDRSMRTRMKKLTLFTAALVLTLPTAAQDSSKVVFVPANQIELQIRKAPANAIGESEIDLIEHTAEHAAILLRRTAPGKAEVHQNQADIWYVIDGGCRFVTGGSVVGGAETTSGEIRGSSISGGDERTIAKGDFIRVPAGVPHWVKKIEGKEIVYIVVKVAK